MLACPGFYWDEHGTPRSSRFNDRYFLADDACAAHRALFVQGADLTERWPEHFKHHRHFTVAETGFGSGLNFLLCAQAFLNQNPDAGHCLHYYATEAFPLTGVELAALHGHWPELAPLAEELRAAYPCAVAGFHRRVLQGGRLRLTLLFGDSAAALSELYSDEQGLVDAWFLDGFAPEKNPAMWSEALWSELRRLSRPGASLAASCADEPIALALRGAGFEVQRADANLRAKWQPAPRKRTSPPWFSWPAPAATPREATVIGGGLAGTSTAHALAERGWHVTLLERHGALAQEASGNSIGALYPHLHPQTTPTTRLFLSAYLYALAEWQRLRAAGKPLVGAQDGVALLAHNAARQQSLQALLHELALPETLLRALRPEDLPFDAPEGVLFPQGGWLVPASLCQAWTQHPLIELKTHSEALNWTYHDGQWQIAGEQGRLLSRTPVLVLASGSATVDANWSRFLPLDAVRGQVSHVAASALSKPLKSVICYEGYLTPAHDGQHCLGASFERGRRDSQTSEREHQENHEKLARLLPTLAASLSPSGEGRVAYRLSCRDHLPIVGPLPDVDAFKDDYRELPRGFAASHYPSARYQRGLFAHIAHGSRGLTTAPLCAELLADLIDGTPLPLPRDLIEALSPARFLVRDLQKKKSIDR